MIEAALQLCRAGWRRGLGALAALAVLARGTSMACVGTECMEIWSTEPGGGALTVYWDFAHKKIQTFKSFCAGGQCLYSTIDNGFITTADVPADGYFPLVDGTSVSIQIVAIDPAASLHVNGVPLDTGGESALLGVAPTLHIHPSWQIVLPDGDPPGDYPLSFLLTTDSSLYGESQVFSVVLTNQPTPTPTMVDGTATATPSATPTSTPLPCPGDCNGDGVVSVDELVRGVAAALGSGPVCRALDIDGDGAISIAELVAAVEAALKGCVVGPTPTPTLASTLVAIQAAIFSPRCAIPTCHDTATHAGNLDLSAAQAYGQLVGVPPDVETARDAGLLRVDPGHPENSFLVVKLEGPPPDQGSRMPLTGAPLDDGEIQVIREWIALGAQP